MQRGDIGQRGPLGVAADLAQRLVGGVGEGEEAVGALLRGIGVGGAGEDGRREQHRDGGTAKGGCNANHGRKLAGARSPNNPNSMPPAARGVRLVAKQMGPGRFPVIIPGLWYTGLSHKPAPGPLGNRLNAPPMKTRTSLLVLTAALLVPGARLLAQTAPASENMNATFRIMTLDLMEKQVREADEREAGRARTARLSAATYDLNHDGKLDDREFAAWEKNVRAVLEETPKALKKYDLNHDKKLDDAEWAVARKELLGS